MDGAAVAIQPRHEQDYLEKLEAIRRNNFEERRANKQKNGERDYDPEVRRKKILALKVSSSSV